MIDYLSSNRESWGFIEAVEMLMAELEATVVVLMTSVRSEKEKDEAGDGGVD